MTDNQLKLVRAKEIMYVLFVQESERFTPREQQIDDILMIIHAIDKLYNDKSFV